MKALIAMSGGVDSSVAASLMLRQGIGAHGVTMRLQESARTARDIADAASVCRALGIEHTVLDCRAEFAREVEDAFVAAYESGRTPNPCIVCNKKLKFGRLMEAADERGLELVVTGHYARVAFDNASGRWLLKKGLDEPKDQSYFLYLLSQEQLKRVRFPLGDYTKEEARTLADELRFLNARKHDSQDICFVPDGDYVAFVERHSGKSFPAGDFVDPEGRVVGRHQGIIRYTVGQRKGLGLASTAPWYVAGVDAARNEVRLTHGEALWHRTVYADALNWIAIPGVEGELRCCAKLRSRHREQPCTAVIEGGRLRVDFDEPQRAPTLGQALVLYDGDTVLGGGTICEVRP